MNLVHIYRGYCKFPKFLWCEPPRLKTVRETFSEGFMLLGHQPIDTEVYINGVSLYPDQYNVVDGVVRLNNIQLDQDDEVTVCYGYIDSSEERRDGIAYF